MKKNLLYKLKPGREKTHCEICEESFASDRLEQHRINPGEAYSDDNVIIACDRCHKIVHKLMRMHKRNSDFARGWTNRMYIDGAKQVVKEGIRLK